MDVPLLQYRAREAWGISPERNEAMYALSVAVLIHPFLIVVAFLGSTAIMIATGVIFGYKGGIVVSVALFGSNALVAAFSLSVTIRAIFKCGRTQLPITLAALFVSLALATGAGFVLIVLMCQHGR